MAEYYADIVKARRDNRYGNFTSIGINYIFLLTNNRYRRDIRFSTGNKTKCKSCENDRFNVYAAKLDEDYKIIIDSEDYRMRHEEYIVRNAFKNAEYVRKTGKSKLLEPMNPFERRLIHTALNDFNGVETKSEGDGLYKQVRIIPVKNK